MKLKVGTSCLLILGLGMVGCGKKSDSDSTNTTGAAPITSAEGAQKAVPTAGQLSLSLNLNPAGMALAEDDACAKWGDSMLSAPCDIGATAEELSTIISTFIAEATQVAPTAKDGGWEFVTTIDRATASDEAIESFLTTTCSENESLSVENDSFVMKVFIKQKDDLSIDLALSAGATEDAIISDLITGNWLQTNPDSDVGKGSLTINFAKTGALDAALFEAAGQDYTTVCGEAPESVGSITVAADNTVSPATASLALSADFPEAMMAGQTFNFKFHGEEETEFEMTFVQNMVGPGNDFTLFDSAGEKDETMNFHLGIRHTGGVFAIEAKLSATGGDREGGEPVTLGMCGKYDGTTIVQGYMSVDAPADLAATISAGLLLDPNNEDLKQFSAAAKAEYCPTLEHVEL